MEKINATDPLAKSEDLVAQNIEQLKALFPEITAEGKIDFKVLKHILGEEIEEEEEYYRFTWAGKSQARMEAHKPSTGTLRPAKEESVDWDTTQNLYIEGDNLEVLKLLQKSYAGKVKMIYIDPPYNTGKDFVYKDNYKDNLRNYQEVTGQVDSEGNKLSTNSESDGRYHSNWLNMMYPRLRLARNLLKDDGAIFISIDEVESNNLKQVCNEIFGEINFVGEFVWAAGKKNDSKLVSVSHEYILVYLKNASRYQEEKITWRTRKKGLDAIYSRYEELRKTLKENYSEIELQLKKWFNELPEDNPSKRHKHYSSVDAKGIYFPDNISWPGGGGPKYEVLHPKTKKPVSIPSRGWLYGSIERMQEIIDEGKVQFGEDEKSVPTLKAYLKEREYEVPYSVFYVDGRASSKRLRQLMGGDYFDHPKDEIVLQEIIDFVNCENEIVCDFFAGSGTIGESVFRYNLKTNKNTKFILVQLPQRIDSINATSQKQKKKQAETIEFLKQKKRPLLLSELGKERLIRVIDDIKKTNKELQIDLGFKVFKLDSSNIRPWDGNPENLEDDLFNSGDNIKADRSAEDVLYEVLLKYGLDLTLPIEQRDIEGNKVFSVGYGALFVCLDKEIKGSVAEGIGKWKEELQPELCRVIFRDAGFTDVAKTNATQTLKRFGITEVRSV
ncbi:site-specific DNA-methyltransferase [Crocinitomicaceae bacterium CZZ-1]|uniref:site-specific DNA-methyltransferase (adenine-specific) n=1 Tax=Taishania pollutisoli TaxID=2766479 RepID=A0A8J6PBK0_9FLAO|nr:site-specific DNA-methyltransferase [Taishania pollutisoli]MBC9812193.1 site-specific DNA-methyltransferase [Taishania pollutisoli]